MTSPKTIPFEFYLEDEELLKYHNRSQPPLEGYLFFPQLNDIVEFNTDKPNKTNRRIFEGKTKFYDYEDEKFKALMDEIKQHNIKSDNRLIFPPNWKEAETRRFLQATGFESGKTIDLLFKQFKWRDNFYPFYLTEQTLQLLNSGFLYVHGRDNHFRPILIVNAKVYMTLKDKFPFQEWLHYIVYYMDYIIKYMMIPGQVENWILISDVNDVSMLFLPNDLKKLIAILQSNYRCRLYANYIVGMGTGLQFVWKCIQPFLDETTVNKVKIIKQSNLSELFAYINPSQLEVRYGGKAKNKANKGSIYFPPTMPCEDYLKPEDDRDSLLMDERRYKQLYYEGKVVVTSQKFLAEWERKENFKLEKEETKPEEIIVKSKEGLLQKEKVKVEIQAGRIDEIIMENERLEVDKEMDFIIKKQLCSNDLSLI